MTATGRIAILHIGGEKTGSTTLQATLALNRPTLAQRGILYSRVAGAENHHLLALHATAGKGTEDLRAASGLAAPEAFAAAMAELPGALRREAEDSGAQVVIYSSEHLSSRIRDAEGVRRLHGLLAGVADAIGLVYYARPQVELVLSAWSTMLKSGHAEPFDLDRILANETPLDHAALVARWGGIFADPHWILRPYQREALTGGDIVEDFCAQAGLPPAALPARVPPQNRALDAAAAEFLRLYNRATGVAPGSPQQAGRGELVRALEALSAGPPMALPEGAAPRIEARFAAGNAALARRFLGQASLFGALAPTEGPPAVPLTVDDAVGIAAALWQVARGGRGRA
jgi:hypothetical protein